MNAKRVVRGLFGALEAEASGQEWSLEGPSENYIPGLGWGASEDVRRWAMKGYLVERSAEIENLQKRNRGRPAKGEFENVDCVRAFQCWKISKLYNAPNLSILKAIDLVLRMEKNLNIPDSDRTFPPQIYAKGTLESSVKKGRRQLGIGKGWKSTFCDEVDWALRCDMSGER